jgi:hypothetical protein
VECAMDGLIWLRKGTGDGLLWMRWWTFGFHKMRRISCLAENTVSFSRRTLLHGVTIWNYKYEHTVKPYGILSVKNALPSLCTTPQSTALVFLLS